MLIDDKTIITLSIFESIDMKSIFSISIFIFLCGYLKAQLLVTPSFQENTLVNNPAALGAIQKEGIQINTFSTRVFNRSSFSLSTIPLNSSNGIIPNALQQLSSFELKNFSAISYHKTQTLPNEYKITVGLQLQTTQNRIAQITANNTYGFTANVHIPLKKANRERYFSAGLQMNLIHQRPVRAVTAFAFENLIEMPTIDFTSFNRQFSNTGFQYTLNTSYLTHNHKMFLFNFGLSFSAIERKLANTFSANGTGTFSFRSNVFYGWSFFFNSQVAPSEDKFMIETNLFLRNNVFAGSFGFGFRLNKKTILRVNGVVSTRFRFLNFGTTLGLEISKFSYFIYFGNIIDTRVNSTFLDEDFEGPGKIIQAGAYYRLNGDKKPTLLNLKY